VLRRVVAVWVGVMTFLLIGASVLVVSAVPVALALSASAILGSATAALVWFFPDIVE